MNTTQLFVELLINGFGVVIWLFLLLCGIFHTRINIHDTNMGIIVITPLFCFSYALGIVIDRIARRLFHKKDYINRIKVFGKGEIIPPDDQSRYIFNNSKSFKDKIIYNRSRLRICRSWTINFLLIAICFMFYQLELQSFSVNSIILCLILFIFSYLSYHVWNLLSVDHYLNIKYTFRYLLFVEKDISK